MDEKQDYFLTHAHVGNTKDTQCAARRSDKPESPSEKLNSGTSAAKRTVRADEIDDKGCSTILEFQRKFDTCDNNDYIIDVSLSVFKQI